MTRIMVAVVAAAALAACGSSASAPSSTASTTSSAITDSARCGPASAHTLAVGSGARVYSDGGTVYGCASGNPRHYRLGSARSCLRSARVGPVAAAGLIAAYGVARCGIDFGSSMVVVRRLSDGAQLFRHAAGSAGSGPESYGSVGSIVVTPSAAVAWIAVDRSIVAHRVATQVMARGGSGRVRVLQTSSGIGTSSGIVPGSLRLHGATLSWRVGTATRSASLG
jgi:hypothetical protein